MTIGVAMDAVGQGLFLQNIIIELLIQFPHDVATCEAAI